MNRASNTTGSWYSAPWSAGRIVSAIVSAVAVLLGLTLVLIGGTILSQQNDGAIDLGEGEYQGQGYAVVSAPLDWSTETYLGAELEQASFDVAPADSAELFIGLTASGDAEQYLSGESRSVDDGYRFTYTEYSGAPPQEQPEDIDIWTAAASGEDSVDLSFDTAEQPGEQVLVIMRADGEPLGPGGVDSYGIAPAATAIAVGLLVVGGLLVVASVVVAVMIFRAVRVAKVGRAV